MNQIQAFKNDESLLEATQNEAKKEFYNKALEELKERLSNAHLE